MVVLCWKARHFFVDLKDPEWPMITILTNITSNIIQIYCESQTKKFRTVIQSAGSQVWPAVLDLVKIRNLFEWSGQLKRILCSKLWDIKRVGQSGELTVGPNILLPTVWTNSRDNHRYCL